MRASVQPWHSSSNMGVCVCVCDASQRHTYNMNATHASSPAETSCHATASRARHRALMRCHTSLYFDVYPLRRSMNLGICVCITSNMRWNPPTTSASHAISSHRNINMQGRSLNMTYHGACHASNPRITSNRIAAHPVTYILCMCFGIFRDFRGERTVLDEIASYMHAHTHTSTMDTCAQR